MIHVEKGKSCQMVGTIGDILGELAHAVAGIYCCLAEDLGGKDARDLLQETFEAALEEKPGNYTRVTIPVKKK